ncbi:U-box domain-containing protein 11-like isoform X2 [Apium graveolens]|uniref:U-box domain-containing protein 11-like isoform X2 n=1 Tax=Apium graveolens TaxID=4045 RepID=UPI003D7BF317
MANTNSSGHTTHIESLLCLVKDVTIISAAGYDGPFKKDCMDLSRRIVLLSNLFEEFLHFKGESRLQDNLASSSTCSSCLSDFTVVLEAAKALLASAGSFDPNISPEGSAKKIAFQFQCLTWKLETALRNLSYDQLDVSEEVQEQVNLVREQLRRATERYGGPVTSLSRALSQPAVGDVDMINRTIGGLHVEDICNVDGEVTKNLESAVIGTTFKGSDKGQMTHCLESRTHTSAFLGDRLLSNSDDAKIENSAKKSSEEKKLIPPDDFLCPISLEMMRDPVIVATGQTYERYCIQRWIDCGNKTCPKTQQKLQHVTLTPNYVLRSLITQWCVKHNVDQPTALATGRMKRSDGTFSDVSEKIAAIEGLVRKLSSHSIEECREAVTGIRTLSKRSTGNRILIGEAGAIPILVQLLMSEDSITQENAVTSILNLSLCQSNKGRVMLAGAIPLIIQVLRSGSIETKENAAATLFSLSLADENKIIIGASDAIPALVDLLQSGSTRGKKDAATALFNLCLYHRNKSRAVRAGIITVLSNMLKDTTSCMVDEALTILSVLASHQEAKVSITKTITISVLIDHLRTGVPQNKENSAAILLTLCKRDTENLSCISRLGAVIPLMELVKSGTDRAKRKAMTLLDHLHKLKQL